MVMQNQLNAELTGYKDVSDGDNPGEGNKEDEEPFSIGDTIGKALALVTQLQIHG